MIGIRALASAAMATLSVLPACGGSDASFVCSSTAGSGTLAVNAPGYTCGSVGFEAITWYEFSAAASEQHTVALASTSGNPNLCFPALRVSPPQGGGLACPLNVGTEYDQLVFTAEAGATYQVGVVGALVSWADPATGASASYGIRVTSP